MPKLPQELIDKVIAYTDYETAIKIQNTYAINKFRKLGYPGYRNKFIINGSMELHTVKENDFSTCLNLLKLKNIKFYYSNNELFKLNRCGTVYYVANNKLLYTYEENKLNPCIYQGKIQLWY